MCLFITTVLPKKEQNNENINKIFSNYWFKPVIIDNKSVKKHLSWNDWYFSLTQNYCDCDSFLWSNSFDNDQIDISKEIKKKQKKWWGEEKIRKWLLEKEWSLNKKNESLIIVKKKKLIILLTF